MPLLNSNLFALVALALTWSPPGVEAFSLPRPKASARDLLSSAVIRSASSSVLSQHKSRLQKISLSVSNDDFEKGEDVLLGAENGVSSGESSEQQQKQVTMTERIRVLTYRAALSTSALLLMMISIFGSSFLSGTGIDGASVAAEAEALLPLAAGVTLLLAPVPNDRIRVATASLGLGAAVSAGVATILSSGGGDETFLGVPRVLGVVSLFSVCIREIYYFGLAYKWEAAISLLSLTPLILYNDEYGTVYPIASSLSALAVGVLAVGKVFEPCREDFVKSNSEFLADDK